MFQHYPDQNTISSSLFSPCISGFTTRAAGDMRKIQAIKDFFQEGDIIPPKIVILEQIHSINIASPNPLHLGEVEILEEADGAVTQEKGVLLAVRVADGIPVLCYDPVGKVIGVVHIGWRGSIKNSIKALISKMSSLNAHPINIRLAFGPAIGECCYTVDVDRYVMFVEEGLDRFEKSIFHPHGAGFRLNLTRLNYELALENGVQKNHIDFFPFCTSCDEKRFFSYRRQHKKNPQQFGEMMGYIMM